MVLLLAWPFIDRRPERRVSRRPVAMVLGVAIPIVLLFLTWQGSKAPSIGAVSAHPGAAAFANALPCGTCHTLADAGTGGQVGPNLDNAKPDYDDRARVHHERQGRHALVQAAGPDRRPAEVHGRLRGHVGGRLG